jgi:ABC-type antimicrobial peptide transport system permease subunit
MRLLPFDYAVRNLARRPVRTLLGIAGNVLVVLLVVAAGAFVRGMVRALDVTASPNNVILLGAGSEESLERSEIKAGVDTLVASSVRGIRSRAGVDFVSPEIQMALTVRSVADAEQVRLAIVRGVTERAFLVHGQVRLTQGRLPQPGADEMLIGGLVADKLGLAAAQLGVGAQLVLDGRPWTVVGTFAAPHTVMDAEIWVPLRDVLVVAKRETISCVVLTLDDPAAFAGVAAFAAQRLDLELSALRETEYFAELTRFFAPIRTMVWLSALLIALGGLLGGINIMYAAFASRARELAALQTLGYRRSALVVSLLAESLLLGAAGALPATAVGLLLLDGVAIRFSMGAFGLLVDAPVVALGLAAGLLLGVLGALPPAWRCLRMPIPVALRAA